MLLISCLVFTGVPLAHAQVDATFGVKGTGMISSFQGDDSDALGDLFESGAPAGIDYSYAVRPGFGAGVFVEFAFDDVDFVSLRPEVGYVQRGDKREDDSGSTTYAFTAKVDYLEIPLLLKLDFGGEAYLVAGPSVGFNIGSPEVELQNLEFINTGEDTLVLEDIGIETEDTVYGAIIGFGAIVDNVWAELRYEHGVSDVFAGPADVQNQGFSLTAGFQF